MGICALGKSNGEICVNIPPKNRAKFLIFSPLIMKLFLSERCTSTASKTETVTRDSKCYKSGILQKFGSLFKNVPYMTVTVEEEWEPTFGF